MDGCDDVSSLAALKESIRESELSLRQVKEVIEAVDARLKQTRKDKQPTASFDKDPMATI